MPLTVGSRRALLGGGLVVRAWDDFTDADGTALESHVASDGGSWAKNAAGSGAGSATIDNNRVHNTNDTGAHIYYHSWAPTSPDYAVEADMVLVSDNNLSLSGPCIRCDPTAVTLYFMRYATSANQWQLWKTVAGASTQIGPSANPILAVGQSCVARIEANGLQIRGFVNGAMIWSVTDSAIPGPGRGGLRFQAAETSIAGLNIDAWRVLQ